MTAQEVIKELSYDSTAYGGKCTDEVRIVAIKALEKQMPKKPRDIIYFGEAGYYVGLCPCCNRGNNSEHQYCYGCGQKLDW